jgi:hypothetical protein
MMKKPRCIITFYYLAIFRTGNVGCLVTREVALEEEFKCSKSWRFIIYFLLLVHYIKVKTPIKAREQVGLIEWLSASSRPI